MLRKYPVRAICNSFKCQGTEQAFEREVEHEPFTDSTPIGVRLGGWLSKKACCTNCGTDVHIPVTDEEWSAFNRSEREARQIKYTFPHIEPAELPEEFVKAVRQYEQRRQSEGAD